MYVCMYVYVCIHIYNILKNITSKYVTYKFKHLICIYGFLFFNKQI